MAVSGPKNNLRIAWRPGSMDAEKYHAKFNDNYTLHLEKRGDDRWQIRIDGPLPLQKLQSAPALTDAMEKAYCLCESHFNRHRIQETYLKADQMKWHTSR